MFSRISSYFDKIVGLFSTFSLCCYLNLLMDELISIERIISVRLKPILIVLTVKTLKNNYFYKSSARALIFFFCFSPSTNHYLQDFDSLVVVLKFSHFSNHQLHTNYDALIYICDPIQQKVHLIYF